jgi:hypothetical protein
VDQLHEPHAALDQPPGQQAVVGVRRLARLRPVQLQDRFRLLRQVHQLRGARLHAVGHLVGADAGGDLRVADGPEVLAVQAVQRFQGVALGLAVDTRRVGQEQHRVAGRAE